MIAIISFVLLFVSCSKDTSKMQSEKENNEFVRKANEMATRFTAEVIQEDYLDKKYSIEIQEELSNKRIVVENTFLQDIYKQDDKIYASFYQYDFSRSKLYIVEINDKLKTELIYNLVIPCFQNDSLLQNLF